MMEMKVLASQIKDYDAELQIMSAHLNQLMMTIPNRPDASVPAGTDDSDNKEVRKFLEPTKFDFKPKAHWDIGHDLGILDPEIGAKVAGSRFVFYKGLGARLERVVMNFMLNTHCLLYTSHSCIPIISIKNGSSGSTFRSSTIFSRKRCLENCRTTWAGCISALWKTAKTASKKFLPIWQGKRA